MPCASLSAVRIRRAITGKTLFALLVALFAAPAWAELEVIPLQHRSAEEVLPVIRPLLEEGAAASGANGQLILRASPRHLRELKNALASIDVAPRRLRISVMQDVDSETAARLTEVSGAVSLNRNAGVHVPGGGGEGGLNVEIGRGRDSLNARIISTRALEDGRKMQQIQVLEGKRAQVRSGQSVPVVQHHVVRQADGVQSVVESSAYRDAVSGFFVLPRISGDRVTLEISAQDEEPAPDYRGVARIHQTSSTVSGRLGEWLPLGETGLHEERDGAAISTRTLSRSQERRYTLIRVEEVSDTPRAP